MKCAFRETIEPYAQVDASSKQAYLKLVEEAAGGSPGEGDGRGGG